jgi:mannitol 2-dehydrogenase
VLPIVREALAKGGSVEGLALVEALWARMCFGEREDGSVIESNDPSWSDLRRIASAAKDDPQAWLEQLDAYGDLRANQRFAAAFGAWLRMLWAEGTQATLAAYRERA